MKTQKMKWNELRERQRDTVIERSRKAQEPTMLTFSFPLFYLYAFIYRKRKLITRVHPGDPHQLGLCVHFVFE